MSQLHGPEVDVGPVLLARLDQGHLVVRLRAIKLGLSNDADPSTEKSA